MASSLGPSRGKECRQHTNHHFTTLIRPPVTRLSSRSVSAPACEPKATVCTGQRMPCPFMVCNTCIAGSTGNSPSVKRKMASGGGCSNSAAGLHRRAGSTARNNPVDPVLNPRTTSTACRHPVFTPRWRRESRVVEVGLKSRTPWGASKCF